jgi:hypothetical protein
VNESSWLKCTYPLRLLADYLRGRATKRKLRLLACACCYDVWAMLADQRSRKAVEMVELYADGLADDRMLHDTFLEAVNAIKVGSEIPSPEFYFPHAAAYAAHPDDHSAAHFAIEGVAIAKDNDQSSRALQLHRLRDIFGNPFHPVTINLAWLAWNDGTIRRIAGTIYDERAFDRMPILADALEDAGCDNADILNHCRTESLHVRGCWVIDGLLGKQ